MGGQEVCRPTNRRSIPDEAHSLHFGPDRWKLTFWINITSVLIQLLSLGINKVDP